MDTTIVDGNIEKTAPTLSVHDQELRDHLLDLGTRLDQSARIAFSSIVGFHERNTVRRWLKGDYLPVGLGEAKARMTLAAMGYKFRLLDGFHPLIYKLAQHVGYGLLSVEKFMQLLDYKDHQAIYRIVNRGIIPTHDRMDMIRLYVEENQADLDEWVDSFPFRGLIKEPGSQPTAATTPKPIEATEVRSESAILTDKQFIINLAADLIRALSPVASQLASDGFSPEDRESLRSAVGSFGVFNLKNDLIKLCGERARASL